MNRGTIVPLLRLAALAVEGLLLALPGQAAVVVLANYTAAEVRFSVANGRGEISQHALEPAAVLPIPAAGELRISFDAGGKSQDYRVAVDSAYYFGLERDGLQLRQIDFGPVPEGSPSEADWAASHRRRMRPIWGAASVYRIGVVPVLLLVDDNQPLARAAWEKELRRRLEAASDILQRYSGMRFRVAAENTWQSDPKAASFLELVRDFARKVDPAPAALAIGFTYQPVSPENDRRRLGGMQGPLGRHLLIEEGGRPRSEPERLEVLVHELGHFLGAVHSADPNSVMRPILADARARSRAFAIAFDPANTLAMSLVTEEMRRRGIESLWQLSPATRQRLRAIYSAMAAVRPEDESTKRYMELLDHRGPAPASP